MDSKVGQHVRHQADRAVGRSVIVEASGRASLPLLASGVLSNRLLSGVVGESDDEKDEVMMQRQNKEGCQLLIAR